jgi:transcription elongation factor GreA
MRPTYLTREGYQKLKEEFDYLNGPKRREISKQIGEARAHGDISENAEYDAAKEAQAHLERRIAELKTKLAHIRIIEDEHFPDDKVYIGAKVRLLDYQSDSEVCYHLVSSEEADYKEGKISTTAPVGKALLGHEVGDMVEVKTPNGVKEYEILEISR